MPLAKRRFGAVACLAYHVRRPPSRFGGVLDDRSAEISRHSRFLGQVKVFEERETV